MEAEDDDVEDELEGIRIWGLKRLSLDMDEAEARAVLRKHDGLLRTVMHRYRLPKGGQGLTTEDQYAIGQVVLLQAYKRHDPQLGAFSTLAVTMLEQSFSELARRVRGQTKSEQVSYLRARDGEELTPAQRAYADRYEQRRFLCFITTNRDTSEAGGPKKGTGKGTVSEEAFAADTDPEAEHVERDLREWLYAKLANGVLTKQERAVLQGFLRGLTFREIGRATGVTRQRAQQVWADAVAKLQSTARRENRPR